MKKAIVILSCLLLIATVGMAGLNCGSNTEVEKPTINWRLATYSMAGTLQTNLLQAFSDKVSTASDGQLQIKVFVGGTLYQGSEIFDAVSSGAIDLGFTGGSSYISKVPKTSITSMYTNVVSDNITQIVTVNSSLTNEMPYMVSDANNNNYNHLLWAPTGSVDNFFKFPVASIADLKGKKLGCTSGVASVVQLLGATPVPMDISEAYLSLKTGIIEGWVMCPLDNYVTMKLYEVAPYLLSYSFNGAMSLLMSQTSFDALPANLQTIVSTAAQEIQAQFITEVEASTAGYINTLKAMPGVNVKVLEGAERTTWFNAAYVPVFTGMLAKYLTADEVTQVKSVVDRVKTTGK